MWQILLAFVDAWNPRRNISVLDECSSTRLYFIPNAMLCLFNYFLGTMISWMKHHNFFSRCTTIKNCIFPHDKRVVRKAPASGVRGRFDQPFTWSFSRRRMAIRDILQEQDTAYGLWYLIPMSAMLLMVAWVILATHPYPQAGSENALLLLLLLRRSSSIATILYASCARNFAVVVNLKFAAGCSQSLFMFVCL